MRRAASQAVSVLVGVAAVGVTICPRAAWTQVNAHLVAGSDYVVQGVSQTLGASSLQAGVNIRHRNGLYAGVWVAENTLLKNHHDAGGSLREVDYYAGWQTVTGGGGTWTATLSHYSYPGEAYYSNYRYNELAVAWRGGRGFSITAGLSDNLYNYGRRSDFIETAYEQAVSGNLVFNIGAGYHDTERLFGRGYGYWNAGLTWLAGKYAVDLNFIDTNSNATAIFGDEATGSRWVLSVTARVF